MPRLYAKLIANSDEAGWTIDMVPEKHRAATLAILTEEKRAKEGLQQ